MILVAACSGRASGAVSASTAQAMRDLWEQTGGPTWSEECFRGSTYINADPCHPWSPWQSSRFGYGRIQCDSSGTAVVAIELFECNLNGVIPDTIGNLVNLTILTLHTNQLSGTIPNTIGNLVNLTMLDLNSNQLSGTIPDTIDNLINLHTLALRLNQLGGAIPDTNDW
jgi:hypothetical protein